jgi:hypothetical protein
VIVCSVDISRIVDHHCLEVIVCSVDIGRIVETNNYLSPKESINSDGQQFYQYQQNKQSPLT